MFTPVQLLQKLVKLTAYPDLCVAYSGGLDSHVLLHALHACVRRHPQFNVRAIHINHGLSQHAKAWQAHCAQVCDQLKIRFHAHKVNVVREATTSLEAQARSARYAGLAHLMHPHEDLLTAHTRDDQAETVLLQLLRGAGIAGLAAMPERKPFAQGHLLRPLLNVARQALEQYARANQLVWIEDDSNTAMHFDRNYLRHMVMPKLHQRWPTASATLARSAGHCAAAAKLLAELAHNDLNSLYDEANHTLVISTLQQLSPSRQSNVVRYWIKRAGYRVPTTRQLQQILQIMLSAATDAQPYLAWEDAEVRRYRNHLYLMKHLPQHDASQCIAWDGTAALNLPGELGRLMLTTTQSGGITTQLVLSHMSVRFRQGGERCRPAGRKETHSLKKLLQEWQVPPWQRDRIPLLYHRDELVAVVGYCVCAHYAAQEKDMGYEVALVPSHCL